jgi:imidazolonepropionase-like amidohydrolase
MAGDRLVVRNGNVFDSAAATLVGERTVVVEGDRIVAVTDERVPSGEGREVDAAGATVLPGLIDAHVHVVVATMDLGRAAAMPLTLVALHAARALEAMLRRGFTTVRDAGGADGGIAAGVEHGLVTGPELLRAGRALSQTGGHGDTRARSAPAATCACELVETGIAVLADGPDAVRRAAREQLRGDAHAVKVMASGGVASPSDPIWLEAYTAAELEAAVEEAARWRTYVLAHAYTPGAIRRAVEAGVRSIEHGNLLDEPTAALMAERGTFLVPTLVTYWAIAQHGAAFGLPRWALEKVHEVLDAGRRSVEVARDAGVEVGFGTDLLGESGVFQSRELSLRTEVEPAAAVLRSATAVNARLLGREGDLGVVAEGARADLLVVDGDPTADVSLLEGDGRHLRAVVRRGEVVGG